MPLNCPLVKRMSVPSRNFTCTRLDDGIDCIWSNVIFGGGTRGCRFCADASVRKRAIRIAISTVSVRRKLDELQIAIMFVTPRNPTADQNGSAPQPTPTYPDSVAPWR